MADDADKRGEQFGVIDGRRDIAKAYAGDGDAAEINEVIVNGGIVRRVNAFERSGILIEAKFTQKSWNLNEQKVTAGCRGNEINVNITWLDKKKNNLGKNEKKKDDVNDT